MAKKENKNQIINLITLFFLIGIILLLTSIYINLNNKLNICNEIIDFCNKPKNDQFDNIEFHHKMMMESENSKLNSQNYNIPKSPGQDAFGAIAEIVNILNDDKNTDWNRVNISALREHLIDMNLLITDTNVKETKTKYGLIMNISSNNKRTINAIKRMVKTHSNMVLSKIWTSNVTLTKNGAVLKVENKKDYIKIQHLGFYGLMAYGGNHHQKHHLALARGEILFK